VVELRSDGEGRLGVRCFRGRAASEGADFIPLSLEPGGTAVLTAEPSGPIRSGFAITLLAPGSKTDEIQTVGGEVSPPRLIEKTEPHYPLSARKQKKSGVVMLEAIIDQDGRVETVWVARPADPDLNAAASEAVHQWRYEPALKDGKPVRVFLTVTVTFSLH
jgi:protein TonB